MTIAQDSGNINVTIYYIFITKREILDDIKVNYKVPHAVKSSTSFAPSTFYWALALHSRHKACAASPTAVYWWIKKGKVFSV